MPGPPAQLGNSTAGNDSLATVGFGIWGSACLLGVVVLVAYPTAAEGRRRFFLARTYMVYLMAQAIGSVLTICERHVESERAAGLLDLFFWLALLTAAFVYVCIGVTVGACVFLRGKRNSALTDKVPSPSNPLMQGGVKRQEDDIAMSHRQLTWIHRALGVGLVLWIGLAIAMIWLFAQGRAADLPLAVFCYYFPAAIMAFAVIVRLWWSGWPGLEGAEGLWIRRMSVFSGIMGLIDYLIPAVLFLGPPVWQPTFVSRGLDSLLYVPLIIPWVLWVDRQRPLRAFKLPRPRAS